MALDTTTLASLKRTLEPGMQFHTKATGFTRPHRADGTVRKVAIVQTNSFAFEAADGRQVWMDFGKSGGYRREDERSFTFVMHLRGDQTWSLTYTLV